MVAASESICRLCRCCSPSTFSIGLSCSQSSRSSIKSLPGMRVAEVIWFELSQRRSSPAQPVSPSHSVMRLSCRKSEWRKWNSSRCSMRVISFVASPSRISVPRTCCSSGGMRVSRACSSVSSVRRTHDSSPGIAPSDVKKISTVCTTSTFSSVFSSMSSAVSAVGVGRVASLTLSSTNCRCMRFCVVAATAAWIALGCACRSMPRRSAPRALAPPSGRRRGAKFGLGLRHTHLAGLARAHTHSLERAGTRVLVLHSPHARHSL